MRNRLLPQKQVDHVAINVNVNREVISHFDALPDELLVRILQFLSKDDIQKNVKAVSSRLYRLCNFLYFDTFYGKSLRFLDWQHTVLSKMRQEFKALEDDFTLSMFHRPTQNFQIGFNRDEPIRSGWSAAVLCLGGIFFIYSTCTRLYRSAELSNENLFYLFCIAAIFCFRMMNEVRWGIRELRNMQNSYEHSAVTELEITKIKELTQMFPFLQDPNLAINKSRYTRITELKNILQTTINEIDEIEQILSSILPDMRFSVENFITPQSLPEKTQYHAQSMSTFWRSSNRQHESLFNVSSSEYDEPRSLTV